MVNVPNMDANEQMMRAWPEGVPAAELARFDALPPHLRQLVVKRLSALIDAEQPGMTVTKAAGRSGVSRQMFYKLIDRWKHDRSIRSIAPYQSRGARKSALADETIAKRNDVRVRTAAKHRLLEQALALIEAEPDASNGELGRKLVADSMTPVSQPTATRLIQRTRRHLRMSHSSLPKTYAASMLLDIVPVRHEHLNLDSGEHLVAAITLECATGLVLAFRPGTLETASALQRAAVSAAKSFLMGESIDREGLSAPRCRIVLPPVPAEVAYFNSGGKKEPPTDEKMPSAQLGPLTELIGQDNVFARGPRRFGIRTTSIVGHRIGKLRIGGYLTSRQFKAEIPTFGDGQIDLGISLEQFKALAADEIKRWNAPLLEAIRERLAENELVKRGAMHGLLTDIEALIPL